MKEELSFHERFHQVIDPLVELMKIKPSHYKEENLYPNRKTAKEKVSRRNRILKEKQELYDNRIKKYENAKRENING